MFCCTDLEQQVLKIHRGDTKIIPVRFLKDGKEVQYDLTSVKLTVKKRVRDKDFIFQKTGVLVKNEYIIKIEPNDTKELEFGNYVYDVEITKKNGDVHTILFGMFKILGEVS